MSERILTKNNCKFICPANPSMNISINQPDIKSKDTGGIILTEKAAISGGGICPLLTEKAGGTPVPCGLMNASGWISGIERKKKINGSCILNEKSSLKCTSCPEITIKAVISAHSVSMAAPLPAVSVSSGNAGGGTEKNKNIQNTQNNKNTENTSSTEQAEKTSEQKETPAEKRSICSYEHCKKAGNCPYMKAPSVLSTEGAALKLRKNSPKKERAYNETAGMNMEKCNISWNNQAHHMISVNAAYCQYPELVKLGNYFGYDINCPENCCFLPCWQSGDGYGQKETHFRKAQAYEVMRASGLQWHVGQHSYRISLPENILDKYPELRGMDCYNDRINKELKRILAECQQRFDGICPEENYETHKKWFIGKMNGLSADIERHLMNFRRAPKSSFPYFVSLEALRYAYEIPRSEKVILVYKTATKWIMKRFRYTNYISRQDINLEQTDYAMFEISENHRNETIKKMILFCENVSCFLIVDRAESFRLPFSYRVMFQYIDDESGKIKSHFSAMLAGYAESGEDEYISPKAMVSERLRECGIK